MNIIEIVQNMVNSEELTNINSIAKGMFLETDYQAVLKLDAVDFDFYKGIFWFKFSVETKHFLYKWEESGVAITKAYVNEITTKSVDKFDVVLKFINKSIRDENGISIFYSYPTTTNSDCYVFCNCPHFYYYCKKADKYKKILISDNEVNEKFKINNALKINTEERAPKGEDNYFGDKVIKRSKHKRKNKNPNNEIALCKHIIACINNLITTPSNVDYNVLTGIKKAYKEFINKNETNSDGSKKHFISKEGVNWLEDNSTILVDDGNELETTLNAGKGKFSLPKYLKDPGEYFKAYYYKKNKERFNSTKQQLLTIRKEMNNAKKNIDKVKNTISIVKKEIEDFEKKKDYKSIKDRKRKISNLERRLANYKILLSSEKENEVTSLEKELNKLSLYFKNKQAVRTKKILDDDQFEFISDQDKEINRSIYKIVKYIERCEQALKNEKDKSVKAALRKKLKNANSSLETLKNKKEEIEAEINKKREDRKKQVEVRRKKQEEEKKHIDARNLLRKENKVYFTNFSKADTDKLVTDPNTKEKVSLVSLGKNVLTTLNTVLKTGIKKNNFVAEKLKMLNDFEDKLNEKYFKEVNKRIDEINKAGADGHFVNDRSKKSKDFFLGQFNYLYNKNRSMLKDKIDFIKNALNIIKTLSENARNKDDINSDKKIKSFIKDAYTVLNSSLSPYGDKEEFKNIISKAKEEEEKDVTAKENERKAKNFDYGFAWQHIRNSIISFGKKLVNVVKKEGELVKGANKNVNDKLFYGNYGFEDLFRKYRENGNRVTVKDLVEELKKNSALKNAIKSYVNFFVIDKKKRRNINIDKLIKELVNSNSSDKSSQKSNAASDLKNAGESLKTFKDEIENKLKSILIETLKNYFSGENKLEVSAENLYAGEHQSLSQLAEIIAKSSFKKESIKGAIRRYLSPVTSIIVEAFKRRNKPAIVEGKVKELVLNELNK